jgi:hypothetical protein
MSHKFCTYLRLKSSGASNPETSYYKISSPTEFQIQIPPNNREPYTFTDIYYDQYNDIGDHLGKSCSESLATGNNSCIFTFGASKSGKSFTLFGDSAQRGVRNSIAYMITHYLFEYMKWAPKDKTCSVTATFIELENDKVRDLGLAFYKKDELRLNQAMEAVLNQDLEIKEAGGKGYVEDASIIQISSLTDMIETVTLGTRLREALRSSGHLVLCINFSTRVKLEVKSARVCLVEFQNSNQANSIDLQKVLNKIYMSSLNIPVKSIPYKSSRLTLLLSNSLIKGHVFLVSNIDADPSKFIDSQETLKFMKGITNIDKKIKLNYLPGNGSKIVDWAKRLKEEVQDLEFSIQKSQNHHQEKLRNFSKLVGIEEDLENLVSGEKGSREFEFCKKFRESLSTVNNLTERNLELERKNEKMKKVMDGMRAQQSSNYEKNRKHLNALKNEVNLVRNKIVDFEEKKFDLISEGLMSSTQILEKDLMTSHFVLEEKSAFLMGISRNMETNSSDLKSILDIKEIGKAEIEHEFKTKLMENDYTYKQNLKSLEDHFVKEMREKDSKIFSETLRCRQELRDLDLKIESFTEESERLFDIACLQGKAIFKIEQGHFNQGISPVLIPRSHIPSVPSESKFPLIFKAISSKALKSRPSSMASTSRPTSQRSSISSNLTVRSFRTFKTNPRPAVTLETSIVPLLNSPILNCSLSEIRLIGNQLQRILKANIESVKNSGQILAGIKDQMNEYQVKLKKIEKERDLAKEEYQKIFKKRIDAFGAFTVKLPGKTFFVESCQKTQGFRDAQTTLSRTRLGFSRSTPSSKPETFRPLTTSLFKFKK